jgi:hypothetical protein
MQETTAHLEKVRGQVEARAKELAASAALQREHGLRTRMIEARDAKRIISKLHPLVAAGFMRGVASEQAARILATVIWNHRRRWLLHRRSDDSVNGGFWEFPNIECGPVADPLSSLARWLGIGSDRLEPLGQIRHSITRYRFIQHLYCLTGDEVITPPGGEVRWITRSELDSLPLTGAHRRLVARYLTS